MVVSITSKVPNCSPATSELELECQPSICKNISDRSRNIQFHFGRTITDRSSNFPNDDAIDPGAKSPYDETTRGCVHNLWMFKRPRVGIGFIRQHADDEAVAARPPSLPEKVPIISQNQISVKCNWRADSAKRPRHHPNHMHIANRARQHFVFHVFLVMCTI